jgi:D-alanyl-D-alanine carboxypeptidase
LFATVIACGPTAAAPTDRADPMGVAASPPASSGRVTSIADPTERPTPTATSLPELLGALPDAPFDEVTAGNLQASVAKAVASGAPDMIVAVITPHGVWSGAAGVGAPDGRKATGVDEFAIASLTKTFTAALVLRLAEQGRIDLDSPLADYLGNLDVDTNGATVRQALEMRAGLSDDAPAVGDEIVGDMDRVFTPEESVVRMGDPIGKPGGTYAYSSPSYRLLALAASHVTGMSFGAALRELLLDPFGLDRILDQGPEAATPKPWALPIDEHVGRLDVTKLGAGGSISCIASATRTLGSASMASDAPSMAAWLWHLFAGEIVSQKTLALMWPTPVRQFAYGLDVEGFNELAIGNGGSKTGYGSHFVYLPAHEAVIVSFVNDPDFVVEPMENELLRAVSAH